MASDVKERMVEGAAQLLAKQGLQGTSFSEVLELTGAPRGSVYHHFPEGKDQMVQAAVDFTGNQMLELLERKAGAPATEIVEFFLGIWRTILTRSDFGAGCAVLAVTVASHSPELIDHTRAVFRSWRARLAELLEQGGLSSDDAAIFATLLVAASEGAVVLSRADQSMLPFDQTSAQLLSSLKTLAN